MSNPALLEKTIRDYEKWVGLLNVVPRFEKKVDTNDTTKTYIGFSALVGAEETDESWRLARIVASGTSVSIKYAKKSGVADAGYVHVWSDRESLQN